MDGIEKLLSDTDRDVRYFAGGVYEENAFTCKRFSEDDTGGECDTDSLKNHDLNDDLKDALNDLNDDENDIDTNDNDDINDEGDDDHVSTNNEAIGNDHTTPTLMMQILKTKNEK